MTERGGISDPTRLTRRRWYAVTGGWSLVLLPWLFAALTSDAPLGNRVLLACSVLGYLGCYAEGTYQVMRRRTAARAVLVILAMAALWVAMVVAAGDDGGILYTISFLIAAQLAVSRPLLLGGVLAALTCAGGIALTWTVSGRADLDELISMGALCMAMIGMFRIIRVNSQLREAREGLADLAVTAERERIARDLHDVLGHSLTTITVKAGLARRLLESGDTDRAAAEVGDVERLGRQALAEVRSTVAANRVASLARELAGAREALRAAEIEAVLPTAVDDVPPERQQPFAHVLREGVTNVLRHSGATRCTVRLTADSVEVLDDGTGAAAPPGHGITGLAERLAAVGGRVSAGPAPGGGFRLRADCAPVLVPVTGSVGPA